MSTNKKIDISGGTSLGQNPFGALEGTALPPGKQKAEPEKGSHQRATKPKNRGRVEIRREKSGRGGKIVTTATGFQGVCPAEQEAWVSHLKKTCGAGGTAKPGVVEIQGDRRDDLFRFFEAKGFRPVLAGG